MEPEVQSQHEVKPLSVRPGRVRWSVPAVRNREELSLLVEAELRGNGDVTSVRANPLTARILVVFDPRLEPLEIRARVERALESCGAPQARVGQVPAERGKTRVAKTKTPSRGVRWTRNGLLAGSAFVAARWLAPSLPVTGLLWGGAAALAIGAAVGWRTIASRLDDSKERLARDPMVRLLRPYRRRVMLASLSSFLMRGFDLTPPILVGVAVNVVVSGPVAFLTALGVATTAGQLLVVAGTSVVFWVLGAVFEYAQEKQWRGLSQDVQHDLRMEVYSHVQTLDVGFFEQTGTGNLMVIIQDNIDKVGQFLDVSTGEVSQAATIIVAIAAAFLLLPPAIALAVTLPIPLTAAASFYFNRALNARYVKVREATELFGHQLSNNLSGIVTIKSFSAEERAKESIAQRSDAYRQRVAWSTDIGALYNPVARVFVGSSISVSLIWGGLMAASGSVTVGIFSAVVYLSLRAWYPMTRLGNAFTLYQHSRAALARVYLLLDVKPSIHSGRRRLPLSKLQGEVVFDHVDFSYHNGTPVLDDLSLTLKGGEVSAIVGASGAGKTTLINLILRFHDTTSGNVLIDGINIRQLNIKDVRNAIGLISQDVFMFYGTVRENIAFGAEGAGVEQVIEAAKTAIAHEFVMNLPQGYDTIIGERGVKLSGGERQRISIARAILKDPRVLILDEATSSVDNETEVELQESLGNLMEGRTTIIIAHRLSTIKDANCIYVLDKGAICESGKHRELLRQDGLYSSLWKVQQGMKGLQNPGGLDTRTMENNPGEQG